YIKSVLELGLENAKYSPSNPGDSIIKTVNSTEFPGLFCGILTKDDVGTQWNGEIGNLGSRLNDNHIVTFVFSKVLLRQDNWHANIDDNMGYITNKTYSKPSLV